MRTKKDVVRRTTAIDPIYTRFIDDLCSAPELKQALALGGATSQKAQLFLYHLIKMEASRGHANSTTIAEAARRSGMEMETLADIWKNYSQSRAMMKIISATPKLADDVIQAAANVTILCPSCGGEGSIIRRDKSEWECPQCAGSGSVVRAGDRDAREHALEWAGVINVPNKGQIGAGTGVFLSLVLPRNSDIAPTVEITPALPEPDTP